MRTQRFGIESEMTEITRAVAQVVVGHFPDDYTECCFERMERCAVKAGRKEKK